MSNPPWTSITYPNDDSVVFSKTDPIILQINNSFNGTVTVSAGGYMDPEPLVLAKDAEATEEIYTTKPKFTLDAGGYPVNSEYTYDKALNTLFVNIY
ncbi:hypothetical protein K7I13_03255 [Brucepastera parasyntrophica]|uniref:hypothetical protein n=1 Tax=Brucepastera parasyntrophica TaxID=2880008 RepID=UPI00210C6C2F|nr:hypothetical protein [Brucepastera parasyntrophica]ULQ60340.1 hypothetical protein K7I13_03255 [Brucepastera parasyntrophica]